MFATVSFERLSLPFEGKDGRGKRKYDIRIVDELDLIKIRECILHAIGLSHLTPHIYNAIV
jgi:mRNA interferase MazF